MTDKEQLEDLYSNKKMTDKSISELFNCKEDNIRTLRIKFNIKTLDRHSYKRQFLNCLSNEQLKEIVLNNNYPKIQKILGVSSIVWKKELLNRGISNKSILRIEQYPELTQEQIKLIIGSLLGDGCIESCLRYSEGHASNQYLYLKKKHTILKPFSNDIYEDNSHKDLVCYKFNTVCHPCFKKFKDLFYNPSLEGKLMPLEFIKENWHDNILAYWFLDDGHFDEKSGCYTIANKCPIKEQFYAFLNFLGDYYQEPFTVYTDPEDLFSIKIPLALRDRFIKIVLNVATEDMLYKVPATYRFKYREELKPQNFMGSNRITDIRNKILLGHTFEELKDEYPITKALYLRLGGMVPKYITINHPVINEIIGDNKKSDIEYPLDNEIIIGTLMGDGNIFKYGDNTCVFSFAHSLSQVSYIKLKYELLKSYINRIRFLKNTTNDFYSFHVLLRSLPIFSEYHKIFYTAEKEHKKNLQKYLFNEKIVDMITPKVFSFWLMDDGKKYGSGKYMFTITIGKQPYYNYEDFKQFVELLNDKLGYSLRAREEKVSYEITTTPGLAEEVFHKIKGYIWPYFAYKFRVALSDCGSEYRSLPWFSEWENKDANMCNL